MTLLSPTQCQVYLLFFALLWFLLAAWRGWRLGLIRSFLKLASLIVAWFLGSSIASSLSLGLHFFYQHPSTLIPNFLGATLGLGFYMIINFFLSLLFKKTDHYHGFLRIFFGLGGAGCGLLFGLLLLCGGISLIRNLEIFTERTLPSLKGGPLTIRDSLFFNLVELRKTLESGTTGAWLIQCDPWNSRFYENTKRGILLFHNPEEIKRFIHTSSTQQLLATPSLKQALADPSVQNAIATGNIFLLLSNKNIQSAWRDPALWQAMRTFDLSTALREATEKTTTSLHH